VCVECLIGKQKKPVCVECLIGKQKKPILFKVTEPNSVPYRAPSACAKRAAYPDPPPVTVIPGPCPRHRRVTVPQPEFGHWHGPC
jgi:hypothetical protein